MKNKNKNKLRCVLETESYDEAKKTYKFYNSTNKNVRLTKKRGIGYRVWAAME